MKNKTLKIVGGPVIVRQLLASEENRRGPGDDMSHNVDGPKRSRTNVIPTRKYNTGNVVMTFLQKKLRF